MSIDIAGIFSENVWYWIPILVSITVTVTDAINTKFNITGFYRQLVSWIVGGALAGVTWAIGLVQMGNPEWLSGIVFIVIVALCGNGVWDVPVVKEWVNKLIALIGLAPKKA
jgi:hypothetical protein